MASFNALQTRLAHFKRRKHFRSDDPNVAANDPDWILRDVLVWIMWRDLSAVQRFATRQPVDAMVLEVAAAVDAAAGIPLGVPSVSAAFKELKNAAIRDEVKGEDAKGRAESDNPSRRSWKLLDYAEDLVTLTWEDGLPAYSTVVFDRKTVMEKWHEDHAKPNPPHEAETERKGSPAQEGIGATETPPPNASGKMIRDLISQSIDFLQGKKYPNLKQREGWPIIAAEIERRGKQTARDTILNTMKVEFPDYFPRKSGPPGPRRKIARQSELEELRGFLQSAQLRN